ncbi:hypothetical protein Tco_1446218 [Tanacetum coccineum]
MNKQKIESKKSKNVSNCINGTVNCDGEADTRNSKEISDNGEIRDETVEIEENGLKFDTKEVVEGESIVNDKNQSLNETKMNETVKEEEKNKWSVEDIDVEEGSNNK